MTHSVIFSFEYGCVIRNVNINKTFVATSLFVQFKFTDCNYLLGQYLDLNI